MTGHTNNIPNMSSSSNSIFSTWTPEQLNALLCNPDFASLLGAYLPSSLHAAGAALPLPVIVSGAPLTAPPSIDNCGGAEDSAVDPRRNGMGGAGATVAPPASAAAAAAHSQQPVQQVQQQQSDEIVIVEERPANVNYVARSSPAHLRPFLATCSSNYPAAAAGHPTVPQPSSPATAGSAAAAAVAVGTAVSEAQTMLLGGLNGLPLNVQVTAGGAILINDLRLPATPESPQNTSFSTTTSSGVSSGASSTTTAARSAAQKMQTIRNALAANGRMTPKREPLSREGSEAGLDLNGRPPIPLCAICSADSTGIHFGVEACAACSAFFRRTVVLKKAYVCPKGGDCITHKDTAGSSRCRACRFTKCITVGMDVNAVQHRRDAIGKMSKIKKEGSPMEDDETSYHDQMMMAHPSTSGLMPVKSTLDEWVDGYFHLSKRRKTFYTEESLTQAFEHAGVNLYPPPVEMNNFSECIFQLWKVEPKLVAEYVNENFQIVNLPAHEKAALFRNFFLAFQAVEEPYLTWSIGGLEKEWWVMPNRKYFAFDRIATYFASNIMGGLNLDMGTAVRIFIPSFRHAMDQVAKQMASMGITRSEMVALSAIVYLDPMAPGISKDTKEYLHKARGNLMASLLKYYEEVLFNDPNPQNQLPDCPIIRYDKLIQISAGVRIHAERCRENMQILSMFEVIPVNNLFNEICNIQSAYNDETRDRLRTRAIVENIVTETKVHALDEKWRVFKHERNTNENVTYISDMKGYKTETMSAPILERDKPQLQINRMVPLPKKEEPDRSSPDSAFVAPAAVLAAAAMQPAAAQLQHSFMRPQPVISQSAAAAAPTVVVGSKRSHAAIAAPHQNRLPLKAGSSSNNVNGTDAVIAKIMADQQRAEMVHKQTEADGFRRYNYSSMAGSEAAHIAGLFQAVDSNIALQLERKNAATVADAAAALAAVRAQQEAPGPSSDKRARLSVVDSGTNPLTPPSTSNSSLLAQLQASQLQQQLQLQQVQPSPQVMVPVSMAAMAQSLNLLQNSMNPLVFPPQFQQMQQLLQMQQNQQNQQLLQQLQMQQFMQPAVSIASLQQQQLQPTVTLASLQQQQQHNNQKPF